MIMRKRTKNNYKLLAVGAAVAGAAGYVAGSLMSPKKEKPAISKARKNADGVVSDVEAQLNSAYKELSKVVSGAKLTAKDAATKKEFKHLIETAQDNKDKASEVISAVKSGKVNDKDLKKAIKDARNSIDHIKDFLKK